MSGHNKWSQIKNRKGVADLKRGQVFSKLLKTISIAAKTEPNPQFNPRLRSTILKAKENNIPQENIERAISKASEEKNLEEIIIEAYGPEGSALIIEGVTHNTNRTISEIKHILAANNGKIAVPGSVRWSFNAPATGQTRQAYGWQPKFQQDVSPNAKNALKQLIQKLEEHEDVQKITTNVNF